MPHSRTGFQNCRIRRFWSPGFSAPARAGVLLARAAVFREFLRPCDGFSRGKAGCKGGRGSRMRSGAEGEHRTGEHPAKRTLASRRRSWLDLAMVANKGEGTHERRCGLRGTHRLRRCRFEGFRPSRRRSRGDDITRKPPARSVAPVPKARARGTRRPSGARRGQWAEGRVPAGDRRACPDYPGSTRCPQGRPP